MSGSSKKKTVAVHSSLPTSPAGETPEVADSSPLKSESAAAGLNERWLVAGVCIFLAAITFAVFGQTLRYEFVNFDDGPYVYENPAVTRGLNLKGVEWAFTHIVVSNWHPLTMMSHMLDCRLYGLNAGGHHLTNVLLHTASVILLFLVLRRMTGFLWRSAFVAAVFAIHPLRVESVAWVAERKDVLSGLFFMLTLWAYVRYVRHPFSLDRYMSVVFLFTLGLLSKPMMVTLPFVLLLLDYWPLNRFAPPTPAPAVTGNGDSLKNHSVPWRLIIEKIPLLALTGATCVATMVFQKDFIVPLPLTLRIGNAVVFYVVYLRQMLCPSGLAVLYPFTIGDVGISEVALSLVLLAGISTGVFVLRRRRPYLLTGWLWYLGMLVPVIGVVHVGLVARADRFTYLPQIGLYLLLTWAAADLCAGWRHRRVVLGGFATVILVALIFCARIQVSYWRNSESLWTHTVVCTSDNFIGHSNLGITLFQKGRVDEAITQYQTALQIKPDYTEVHNNLGNALFQKGNADEAIAQYQQALQINPYYAEACYDLGNALFQKGNVDEAIAHFQQALQIKPDYAEACYNLGTALLQKGNVDEAIAHFQQALQIKPDYMEAHINLGNALLQKGNVDEATTHFQKALQIKPGDAEACYNLGNALLQKGNVDEAITHLQQALQINPDDAEACYTLGNALLQKGKVDEAIAQYQKALQINPDYAEACYTLGNALFQKGKVDEAMVHFQKALQIKPANAKAHNNLGSALLQKGQVDEAIAQYQKALQINSDYAGACYNLGNALLQKGDIDEAIAQYQRALQINPDFADARYNLGKILCQEGRVGEAITHLQKTLQIKPDSPDVLNNLAWLLATSPDAHIRDGVQAVKYAERACELTHHGVPLLVGTLAAAYAEAGRFDDAIAAAQKACALAAAAGDQGLLKRNQDLLALYLKHQPYHEAAEKFVPAAP
jgi:tetratricopeptide (TPR) repeat protein